LLLHDAGGMADRLADPGRASRSAEGRTAGAGTAGAGAARDLAAGLLVPQPLARPAAVYRLREDLELHLRLQERLEADERAYQVRFEGAGWLTRWYVRWMERIVEEQEARPPGGAPGWPVPAGPPRDFRTEARWRASEDTSARVENVLGIVTLIQLLSWPVLWVVAAFLFRGGLTYRIMGLSVVRPDGRPAGRCRCAWRALLVWGPLTGLLLALVLLDAWRWSAGAANGARLWVPWLEEALRWASLVLLMAYPVLAVCFPQRSQHDRLAGTCLVPR
jgi:hypothetical protein